MSLNLDGIEAFLQQQERVVERKGRASLTPKGAKSGAAGAKGRQGSPLAKQGHAQVGASSATGGATSPSDPSTATPEEDLQIFSLYQQGVSLTQIAERTGKTLACISVRTSVLRDQGVPNPPRAAAGVEKGKEKEEKGKGKEKGREKGKGKAAATEKAWTEYDDAVLRAYRKNGKSLKSTARDVDRSKVEVEARWAEKGAEWVRLGLVSADVLSTPLRRSLSSAASSASTSRHASPAAPPSSSHYHSPASTAEPSSRRSSHVPIPTPSASPETPLPSTSSKRPPSASFSEPSSAHDTPSKKRPRFASSSSFSFTPPVPLATLSSAAPFRALSAPPNGAVGAPGAGAAAEPLERGKYSLGVKEGDGRGRERKSVWEGYPREAMRAFLESFENGSGDEKSEEEEEEEAG